MKDISSKEIKKLKKETKKMIDQMSDEEFIDSFCINEEFENFINNDTDKYKDLPF